MSASKSIIYFFYIFESNMKLIFYFTLLLLLALSFTQRCPPPNSQDLLQSGNVGMANNRVANTREHCYSLTLQYPVPSTGLELAISTSQIEFYNPSGGFDFSVRGGRKDGTPTIWLVLMIDNDHTWRTMKISYLVSSRNDIMLGSVIGDTFYVISCNRKQGGKTTVSSYVPKWRLNKNSNYAVSSFISGLRTKDSQFDVNILNSNIDVTDGRVAIQIETNAHPSLQIIHLSFIVYPLTHQHFTFSKQNNPTNDGTYSLTGINSFNQAHINFDEFRICKKGTTCPINEQPNSNGQCSCRIGYIRVNGKCYRQCAENRYISENIGCSCIPGYIEVRGQCQQQSFRCPSTEEWNGSQCICKNSHYRNRNGQCVRIPECRQNEVWKVNRCECSSGYRRNNAGRCEQIRRSACKTGEVEINGQCVCVGGFIMVNKKCERQCGQNRYFNQFFQCLCIPGYQQVGNRCVSKPCQPNQRSVNGKCECKDGFFRSFQLCWPIPQCPPNQQWKVSACQCKSGFIKNNQNQCIPESKCSANEVLFNGYCECRRNYYRNNANACVEIPQCGENKFWGGNSCVCRSGWIENTNGVCVVEKKCQDTEELINLQCVCKENYVRVNNFCVEKIRCQENQVAVNNVCSCKPDYNRDNKGDCIKCPEFQIFKNGACECISGYIRSTTNKKCIKPPLCSNPNEILNPSTLNCQCENGYIRLGSICVSRCGINQQWVNNDCVCKQGHAWVNGACRQCPPQSTTNPDKTQCICPSGSIFDDVNVNCVNCGANSSPNSQKTECLCNEGYEWNGDRTKCDKIVNCPPNSMVINGICRCKTNYYDDNGVCKAVPTCPPRSIWKQNELKCQCTNNNEYLINGRCQSCKANQIWVKNQCECSIGYFKIDGICRTCDPHTTYNGQDCKCNFGYYGNRDKCYPCHGSCGQCSGSGAEDCISCSDITLKLENGYCVRNGPCPIGSYSDESKGVCEKCSDYCRSCKNTQECEECSVGFKITEITLGAVTAAFCEPICGDGRRNFGEDCDDGNKNKGDGCDDFCREEDGWNCAGGTTIKKSTCEKGTKKAVLEKKGAVFYLGKVIQSIRVSYLPDCITKNDCAECYKVLSAKVQNTTVPATITINFTPLSKYQFTIETDFGGTFISSAFTLVVEINKKLPQKYDGCFSEEELNQQLVINLDPALLALPQEEQELSLDGFGI